MAIFKSSLHVRVAILRHALRQVLKKPCPNVIPPLTGKPRAVNCFAVLVYKDGQPDLFIESLNGDTAKCQRWDGRSFSVNTEESLRSLVDSDLRIVHYWRLATTEFTGAWDFLRHRYTRWCYAVVYAGEFWNPIAQFLFNRRSLRSQRRLSILRVLASKRLSEADGWMTYFEVMTELYSSRWTHHPDHEARSSEVQLQLESLEESRDAEGQHPGLEYRVTAKGLATLEQAEQEDRRHSEIVMLQALIVLLTLVIALAALIQARVIKIPTLLILGGE